MFWDIDWFKYKYRRVNAIIFLPKIYLHDHVSQFNSNQMHLNGSREKIVETIRSYAKTAYQNHISIDPQAVFIKDRIKILKDSAKNLCAATAFILNFAFDLFQRNFFFFFIQLWTKMEHEHSKFDQKFKFLCLFFLFSTKTID